MKFSFIIKGAAFVIVLIFLVMFKRDVYATDQKTLSDNEIETQLNEVDQLLQEYKRADAYEVLLELKKKISFEEQETYYLEVLAKILEIEDFYMIIDESVNSAIELYQLAEEGIYYKYRILALDVLAYYDYYNFNDAGAVQKLEEMLALQTNFGKERALTEYYYGFAMQSFNSYDYKKVIEYLRKAEELIDKNNEKNFIGIDKNIRIYRNIASAYCMLGNLELAQEAMLSNMKRIDKGDYELRINNELDLAYYYSEDGKIEEAKKVFNQAKKEYEYTSKLFKEGTPNNSFDINEASIAFNEGNYERSAVLYYQLYQTSMSQEAIEAKSTQMESSINFGQREINKQLSLLGQLEKAQGKVIKLYQWGLFSSIIFILFTLFTAFLFYNQKKKYYRLSVTDQLTNVSNRRSIMKTFDGITNGTKCIAMIDLDYFKKINDTYGHFVGDEVLKKVASTVRECIRNNDDFGRYGGEEFLIIFDTNSIQIAAEIAERIRSNVENIQWLHKDLKTTISIGLIFSGSLSGDILLKEADRMLYKSKSTGRNRVSYATIEKGQESED